MMCVGAITHTVLTLHDYVIMICVSATTYTMHKILTCLFTTYVYVHMYSYNFNFAYLRLYIGYL